MTTKIYCGNCEKRFPEGEKNGFKKDLLAFPPSEFFDIYIIDINK